MDAGKSGGLCGISSNDNIVYMPLSGSIDISDLKQIRPEQIKNGEIIPLDKTSGGEGDKNYVDPDSIEFLYKVKQMTEKYDIEF